MAETYYQDPYYADPYYQDPYLQQPQTPYYDNSYLYNINPLYQQAYMPQTMVQQGFRAPESVVSGRDVVRLTPRQQLGRSIADYSRGQAMGQVTGDLAPIQNINLQYSNRYGTPTMQRGITQVGGYDVPVALAQLMAHEQAVNQGRGDVYGKYLGQGFSRPGQPYQSDELRHSYLRGLRQQYAGQGAVSPFADIRQREADIQKQWQEYNRLPPSQQKPTHEYASATGGVQRRELGMGDYLRGQEEQLRRQRESTMFYGTRREKDIEDQQRRSAQQQLRELEAFKPTTSNLQIRETVQR